MKHHPIHALYNHRTYGAHREQRAAERQWLDGLAARNTRRAEKQRAAHQQADSHSKRLSSVLLVVFIALLGWLAVSVAHGQDLGAAEQPAAGAFANDIRAHVVLHGLSYHLNRRSSTGERYNEINEGFGLRLGWRDTLHGQVSYARNSHHCWSTYIGAEYTPITVFDPRVRLGVFAAAASNYGKSCRTQPAAQQTTQPTAQAPADTGTGEPLKKSPKHRHSHDHTRTQTLQPASEPTATSAEQRSRWIAGGGLALRVQGRVLSTTVRFIPEIKGFNSAVFSLEVGARFY